MRRATPRPGWASCWATSPRTTCSTRGRQRIRAVLPQARLLVLKHNPVERALSQFFHARRHGFEPLELEAALAAEPRRLAGAEAALALLMAATITTKCTAI